jgi:hypothetical protein
MRVDILSLWHLYNELKRRNMQELCPSEIVPEGLIPFYDGGMGKAQDEEGNFIPTVADRTTRIF